MFGLNINIQKLVYILGQSGLLYAGTEWSFIFWDRVEHVYIYYTRYITYI